MRACLPTVPVQFAVSGVLYDGKLVADHPIGGRRFQNIMEKEVGIKMTRRDADLKGPDQL